jgi:hypothetical protein
MSEREQEALEQEIIDPPESQDSGGNAAMNLESNPKPLKPLDPPDGNGGTGGG